MQLVSWNIQGCRGCDGRVAPARIVEQARALADFDVLCLQEVAAGFDDLPGSAGENQFAELAALLPGHVALPAAAVDLPGRAGARKAFGNMIFSRLPVLQVQRIALPWPADASVPGMPRVLIDATVVAPWGRLRVMTTHLEYYSPIQRQAQVLALREHHAQMCAQARAAAAPKEESGPFRRAPQAASAVLTGDFNFRPESPLHAHLCAPLRQPGTPRFADAWLRIHPDRAHAHTAGVHDREQWAEPMTCDFAFVTTDLLGRVRRVEVDGDTQASDHQPLLIELD